ncbi:EAL domain-containing protein [Acetobacteraceae bacterium KSS8]|uniref:EAL domain-containing protein n=1 Tax=Endosaccharibacter trunci TaxID=2812733 RepID=A0ABT1W8N9_9PROT|nr:EAL domain-containing protein [Acetobacteraceae bacterium KSS8]
MIVLVHDELLSPGIHGELARTLADEVHSFDNPLSALDWLALNEADLVIADIQTPELDAAAFIRRLRALPGRDQLPVLLVTAPDDHLLRRRALNAGAADFLLAPVDEFEFFTRCRTLLRLNRQRLLLQGRSVRPLPEARDHRPPLVDRVDSLAQMIDTVPAFISAADPHGRVIFTNAMHTAGPERAMDGRITPDPAPDFDQDYRLRSRALDALVFRSGRALPAFEQDVAARNGGRRVLLTTKSPLRDRDGRVDGVLTTSLDITARKEFERHLQHAASHDILTGLPNRSLLQDHLNALLQRGGPGGRKLALHLLNLDRFRQVNDRLGHLSGDALLRRVAGLLRTAADPADLVARIGADEFAVLQHAATQVEDAAILAQRLLDTVSRPAPPAEQEVCVTGSIGISLASADTTGAPEMLRQADLAMFQAKVDGGNRLRFFVPDMDRRIAHSATLQRELLQALGSDELVLYYQPQMNLHSGRICGVEALLRWNHPARGLLLPGEFLQIAAEGGLMNEIDEWVLHRACRDAALWVREGFDDIRVSVNISPARVSAERTLKAIADALDTSGLAAALLEIELTERDLVADLDETARALSGLRARGLKVSIDDFGVGYSFLSHVKALPADRIKIDQSFIHNLLTDEDNATIVRAVVAMAHGLRMGVVAEGVETAEQFTQLAMEGCDDIQGFYVSYPLPLQDLLQRLRDNPPAAGSKAAPAGKEQA